MPDILMKNLPDLDELAHIALSRALAQASPSEPDAPPAPLLALDATAGNGHDTLFLAQTLQRLDLQRDWRLLALDIQSDALRQTALRLEAAGIPCRSLQHGEPALLNVLETSMLQRVALLEMDHAELLPLFQPWAGRFQAMAFNLGFLPGSDKRLTTTASSTEAALRAALSLLAVGGVISLHLYTGHAGGQPEADSVLRLTAALPRQRWRVLVASQHNKARGPEHLVLCERVPDKQREPLS